MSLIIPELILESIFRESFKELRENPTRIDDWFSIYNFDYMQQTYGQATIERIKTYIMDNEIPILHAWHDVPSKIPCVTISTLNMEEQQDKAFLGDYGFTEDTTITPTTILSPIVINSFDPTTGWAVVDPSINIGSLVINQLFVSSTTEQFNILGIIDNGTDKRINLGIGNDYSNYWSGKTSPDVGSVVGNVSFSRNRNLVVPVHHNLMVSIHTVDAFMTKNLHFLLLYILLYYKQKLQNRHLLLSTWNSSDFSRALEYLPEHIYTRSIELYMYTFFQWNEAQDLMASAFGEKVRVPKDIYDRVDGDIFTVDTVKS